VRTASWTTTSRVVLAIDASTVAQSKGESHRGSTTSASIPSAASSSAARSATPTIRESATTVTSAPWRTTRAPAAASTGASVSISPRWS
jgi:hypothetical protein